MLSSCSRTLLDFFSHLVYHETLTASSESYTCFFVSLASVAYQSSHRLIFYSKLCHEDANNTRVILNAKLHGGQCIVEES